MKKLSLLLASLFLLATSATGQVPGTFNPLLLTQALPPVTWDSATLTGGGSLSGGNLIYSSTTSASVVRSTRYGNSKSYAEVTVNTAVSGSGVIALGVVSDAQTTSTPTSIATVPVGMWMMRNDAFAMNNGTSSVYGGNWGAGAVLAIAFDNTLGSGSGKVWLGTCSAGTVTWYNSGNPASGLNAMFANLTGNIGFIVNTQTSASTQVTLNSGASAFSCTPPSGYSAL